MRGSGLVGLVAMSLFACANVESERASPAVARGAGGSAAVGAGGTGSVPAMGGASGIFTVGTTDATLPTYARDCIAARLAGLPDGAVAPKGAPPSNADASAPRDAGEGGVDLALGAGDLTLLVVFDKSGSMDGLWDDRTKWQVANDAFMQAIEPVIDNLTIGTLFFPEPDGCSVAPLESPLQMNFAPGRPFASNWRATAADRSPGGSTPLELAFIYADMAIEQACGLHLLDDRFRVVLLTDGEPTCSDDTQHVIELAREWRRLGVETWVMGLPGSTAATQLLDDIALAGGTGKAQMLGTPTALNESLAAAAR